MLGNRYSDPHELSHTCWDLVIIGGGITGAGIALEASHFDKKVLLLEQNDFAWGTSSRSSKMVHGGLRYLAQGDIRLTRDSLQERERLLNALPELVVRKTYLFPIIKGHFPGRWGMKAALWLYDRLAGIHDHSWLPLAGLRQRLPQLRLPGITGAMSYTDALTDDCRLVLRLLHEAALNGVQLANYSRVNAITSVAGERFQLQVSDHLNEDTFSISTRQVVNATGAFADRLSGNAPKVRPQRGSHLFFTAKRLPINDCLTVLHPNDKRPVFLFPWQGVTCVGTTDIDHQDNLDNEARASQQEIDYLLTLVNAVFPAYHIQESDIISCMAGVRPIISSGRGVNPSKERRDHAIWGKEGVITVSGGKLTTFRLIALDVLKTLGWLSRKQHKTRVGERYPLVTDSLPYAFGNPLQSQADNSNLEDRLTWILKNEMVAHLDDLMLRRTRLGILLPNAGQRLFDLIAPLCQQYLGWNQHRWQLEVERYLDISYRYYQPPSRQHQ